ncbi:hypothetical protein [Streptomyces olivaceiscleroticus]|uniref:Terminase small subunit n=1 Tax=Streptomyces olivaceiscleroticus TaxID=68245 RepID=A0ABP3LI93_9ACTN
MPHNRAEQAEVAARRAALLRLRRQGTRYDDERILTLGYSSASAARKDFARILEIHRDEEAVEVSLYRQQENERLDALLEAAWPRATQPSPVFNKDGDIVSEELDMRAVDTVLRLMDRRAKLNGLDAPVRTELSGPDGGAVPLGNGSLMELNTLIGIAGDTNQAEEPTTEGSGDDHDR